MAALSRTKSRSPVGSWPNLRGQRRWVLMSIALPNCLRGSERENQRQVAHQKTHLFTGNLRSRLFENDGRSAPSGAGCGTAGITAADLLPVVPRHVDTLDGDRARESYQSLRPDGHQFF